jgi:hypothetical protein
VPLQGEREGAKCDGALLTVFIFDFGDVFRQVVE